MVGLGVSLNKMRTFQIALLICSFTFYCNYAENSNEPELQKTTNKYQESLSEFFKQACISLSIDQFGAHFSMRHDGAKFCIGDPQKAGTSTTYQFEFTISKPGDIFYSLEHHGIKVFTVKSIDSDRIVLKYLSKFDHRSFSKNLLTEDLGEITLKQFQK